MGYRITVLQAFCLGLCFEATGLAQAVANDPSTKTLTTCAEVRRLKPKEADRGHRVRLEAVVTAVPGMPYSGLVVQDHADGIWVDLGKARQRGIWQAEFDPLLRSLKVGDKVKLEGLTERGGFAPVLMPTKLELLASGVPLPAAPDVTVPSVLSGKHDVQRVTVTGVVQETSVGKGSTAAALVIKIVNMGGELLVSLPRESVPPEDQLLDTQLSVSGTLISRHNSRAEMSGAVLVASRIDDVKVLRPSTPPEKAPKLSLASLHPFEPGGFSSFRRRISGTVTYWHPGQRMILQDGSAAVEVTTLSTQAIKLGSVVEAAGFVSAPSPICRLENAVLRVLQEGEAPKAVEITLPELLDASRRKNAIYWQRSVFDYHFRLVRVKGILVEALDDAGRKGRTLLLNSGGTLLPVHWTEAQLEFGTHWLPGSELAVTGIVQMEFSGPSMEAYEPRGDGDVSLHLRSPADVQVIAAASWWTRQRLLYAGWAALGVIAMVLMVVFALSRRVRQQAAELAGRIALQKEAEIRFEATLAERNRLGADMHDGLQQFLAGLSMQLEVAQGSLEMGRDAAPALQNAKKLLLTLREDFRHCVNAFQSTEAEMDIPGILERTSAIIRACHPVETSVEVKGTPVALPGKAVANLMLIVQEAASNAVRHGKARKIDLRCDFTPESVTVTVQDDGRGFDPEATVTSGSHFGLHNMRERAGQIGGTLRIESQRDAGTSVMAILPLPAFSAHLPP